MIPLARYRFHLRAEDSLSFPRYAGSTWRGALGHALKRTVCVTYLPDCRACLLLQSCVYSYLFETPPPLDAAMLRKYPAAPHPFVLHPEATNGCCYQVGEAFSVELTLIGRANAQLPYLICALRQAGAKGIGKGRGRFALEAVSQRLAEGGWQLIYREGESLAVLPAQAPSLMPFPTDKRVLELCLVTPLRIQHQGHLMGPESFAFRGFLAALLRRLSLLSYFHVGVELSADFRGLLEQAEKVRPLAAELTWQDWERYSGRQNTRLKMGGLLGSIRLALAELEPFWPHLTLGQWVHVGKGAVMGLGGYRLNLS